VAKKGVLNCDGLSDWSLHSIGWSCVALSSCDAISARFRIFFVNTSKNVTIFLEPGTNVKILSHRHIIFLGSAWNKPLLTCPGFWVPGFPISAWNDPQ